MCGNIGLYLLDYWLGEAGERCTLRSSWLCAMRLGGSKSQPTLWSLLYKSRPGTGAHSRVRSSHTSLSILGPRNHYSIWISLLTMGYLIEKAQQ